MPSRCAVPSRYRTASPPVDTALAVLNGVIGDYLHRRGNGLATPCVLVHEGEPLVLERAALARALPGAGRRVAVWIHGLCVDDRVWLVPDEPARSLPALLEREGGYLPLFLRHNSGRHVSENGELLADRLEALVAGYPAPIEELLLVGYSMGGLIARSAFHVGVARGDRWPALVRQAIYLGVPHLGTPLERLGRVVAWALRSIPNAHTRMLAAVADLRSAGIQDMGHGRLLREHWERVDPTAAIHPPPPAVPLRPGIRHGLIAGRLGSGERDLLSVVFGDGMVPLASASLGLHRAVAAGEHRVRIVSGAGHLALLRHPDVGAQLLAWCAEERS